MHCISTRGQDRVSIDEALQRGLARDGGLYVPEHFPQFTAQDFDGADSVAAVATRLLRPFFVGSALDAELGTICSSALDFPIPVVALKGEDSYVLELFHGPTAAFKDVGARFLAECLSRLRDPMGADVTVLAATSGDTGSAVAAAFHLRAGFRAAILFPDGRVSPRQAHLLSCFGDNIQSFAVQGSFDQCQAMVKAAMADAELQTICPLTSANSISLGRLLPQAAYYAHASLQHWRRTGESLNFIIPTGNLGNGLAALYARRMGLPMGEIILGSNANAAVPDFLASGVFEPRASVATIANAMDVGLPSNLERLRALYPDHAELQSAVSAHAISDAQIRARIRRFNEVQDMAICPHTAVAAELLARQRSGQDARAWCIVATAHPAKFETVVEPLIGAKLEIPPQLTHWLERKANAAALAPTAQALRHSLLQAS